MEGWGLRNHHTPFKQDQDHHCKWKSHMSSFKYLDHRTTHVHAYLSDSFRSAEVIGWVLNLSEVFLLSPGEKYRLGFRDPRSRSTEVGKPTPLGDLSTRDWLLESSRKSIRQGNGETERENKAKIYASQWVKAQTLPNSTARLYHAREGGRTFQRPNPPAPH